MAARTFRYAPAFNRLLEYAAYECAERGEQDVRVDHLLLALYREDFPLIDEILASFRVDSLVVLDRLLKANPYSGRRARLAEVTLTPEAMQAIAAGESEAELAGDSFLTSAHVLMGILHHKRHAIQDLFIREEFVARSQEVLERVRELTRWLRLGAGSSHQRELEILEDGSLASFEARPVRTRGAEQEGLAVHLKLLKRFA